MLARLICETKEREEDEGTQYERPAVKLEEDMQEVIGFPNDARDLYDPGIVQVGVGPAHPRSEPLLDVGGKNPRR
jgi:hypothetical protein